MAEHRVAVTPDTAVNTNEEILADRQRGWAFFTQATTWAVVIIVVLLIALKVLFG